MLEAFADSYFNTLADEDDDEVVVHRIREEEELPRRCRNLYEDEETSSPAAADATFGVKRLLGLVGLCEMESQGYMPLCEALEKRNARLAAALVAEHAENGNNEILLQLASAAGMVAIVNLVLRRRVNIDAATRSHQETALHISTANDHPEVVEILLERGANVHLKTYKGWTALALACRTGSRRIVEKIISKGGDVNSRIELKGRTPLSIACVRGYKQVVDVLIRNGADVEYENEHKETALHCACLGGNSDIVKLLLERGSKVNIIGHIKGTYQTPLHIAAEKGHPRTVKLLLQYNADVNILNEHNETALHLSCIEGDEDTIKMLLRKGANPNATLHVHRMRRLSFCDGPNSSDTPLITAIYNQKVRAVQLLLENGARVDEHITKNDWTELHIGCETGNELIVQQLLQYGANVNAKTKYNETPLHKAIRHGNFEIAQILIENGANLLEQSDSGWSALHAACGSGKLSIVDLILEKGVDINSETAEKRDTALHIAAKKGSVQLFHHLLKKGASVHKINRNGSTILHSAASTGSLSIVTALIKKDVIIDYLDKKNRTPLYLAFKNSRASAVNALLSAGSNLNLIFKEIIDLVMLHENSIIFPHVDCVIKHIIRLKTASRPIYLRPEFYELKCLDHKKYAQFRSDCQEEVEKLRKELVSDSNFSFYHFLTKGVDQVAIYLDNENIIEEYHENVKSIKTYRDMIENKFEKGLRRLTLINPGLKCVDALTTLHMPYICTSKVIGYLNNIQIENLIEACTNNKTKNMLVDGAGLNCDEVEHLLKGVKTRPDDEKKKKRKKKKKKKKNKWSTTRAVISLVQ